MKRLLLVIHLSLTFFAGLLFQPSLVFAQEETQVTTTEVVEIQISPIWRGVQIFAFIALLVCLFGAIYGLYLWRTGTNNNDLLATERGRRNAIIFGLLFFVFLILFLIAFIVIRRQQNQGALPPTETAPVGSGGFATTDVLLLVESAPLGDAPIRNIQVSLFFNQEVSQSAIDENLSIKNIATDEVVLGEWTVDGSYAQFVPNQGCPAPNNDLRCFDENTIYEVILQDELTSLDGDAFRCAIPSDQCSFRFSSGDQVDANPPTVAMTLPFDGDAVPVESAAILEALAKDDISVSFIEFFVDGERVGIASASSDSFEQEFRGASSWGTEGQEIGSEHVISATAHDLAGFEATSQIISVEVLPLHCFDQVQNLDEEQIDCGGSECRACNGLACTDNSDCASGLCFDGACTSFPILEEAIADNGAPGTIITLRGRNFGTNPGSVVFLGEGGDADDRIAEFPDCANTWQNDQILVVIPEGNSGPIRIETADGFFDTSDDNKGANFAIEVNEIVRPSLCGITPQSQIAGSGIQLDGFGFGTETESVLIGQFLATDISGWSDAFIQNATIPNIEASRYSVRVQVGEEVSNPVYLQTRPSPTLPVLTSVSPNAGPVGQIFSVRGENLLGTVVAKFIDPVSGTITLASTDLPRACLNFVSPNQRSFRVPRLEPGPYQLFVETDAGKSNSLDFTVNNANRLPGLCALEPDNGPIGTEVILHGEGFGSQTGTVRFNPRIDDPTINSWRDTQVSALVPPQATSGPVQGITTGGVLSNELAFNVGTCSPDSCSNGFECCGNGACQPTGTCADVAPICTYSWVFGTGAGLGGIPRVIEDPSCKTNTQSPSAYKNAKDACVNGGISARFTHNMADSTLTSSAIEVRKCNAGPVFDQGDCQTEVALRDFTLINEGQTGEGFIGFPQGRLSPDTWYQVTISSDVTSEEGVGLAAPYTWSFKTQEGEGECVVDHVEVTPPSATLRELGELQQYTGVPIASNCNVLNGNEYNWRWLSENSGKATVVPTQKPVTQARSIGPTDPGPPVKIFGAIPSENEEDSGLLTIALEPPEVVSKWPNCQTACKNAVIGAKFTQEMQETSLAKPGNIRLLKCDDDTCARGKTQNAGITSLQYNSVDSEIYFLPGSQLLDTGAKYRVVLTGLFGTTGLALSGLNYDVSGDGVFDSHSWIFKVKDENEPCTVESVHIAPPFVQSFLLEQEFDYYSFPKSAPDACSADGQLLNPYSFNWAWATAQETVGIVTNIDSVDPANLIDPIQIVTTKGEGETSVTSSTEQKTGSGRLEVICGYENDSQCPSPATIDTFGVGTDSCCHPRPAIISSIPDDGSSSVCTSLSIEVDFDTQLLDTSVITNTFVEFNNGSNACPGTEPETTAWYSGVQKFASAILEWIIPSTKAQAENWCVVDSGVTIYSTATGSTVLVTPRVELLQNQQYRVRFRGDLDLDDGINEGLRNRAGVPFTGEKTITFFTGEAKCNLDLVEVTINPPERPGSKDAFFCAGRNDCKADVNPSVDGNQHEYRATGRDRRGFVVPADFIWRKSGEDVVGLNLNEGDTVEVTASPLNGSAQVTVFAEAKAPSSGSVAKTVRIRVFLCENPWPSLLDFPYVDEVFNFDLFYCRDFGEPGFDDDLPLLKDPIIEPNFGGVLQESIFIIEE